MLLPHALRLLALILFAFVLVDGATDWSAYRREWELVVWDTDPDLPSGIFTLLRLAVSITAAWDAWAYSRYARIGVTGAAPWLVIMALVGLLYQPVFPLGFGYEIWLWLDAAISILLTFHVVLVSVPTYRLFARQIEAGHNPLNVSQEELEECALFGYIRAASLFVPVPTSPRTIETSQSAPSSNRSSRAPARVLNDFASAQRTSSTSECAVRDQPAERGGALHLTEPPQKTAAGRYPSDKMSLRRKALWDSASKLAVDPARTPSQREAAAKVLAMMQAAYQTDKPSSSEQTGSTKD